MRKQDGRNLQHVYSKVRESVRQSRLSLTRADKRRLVEVMNSPRSIFCFLCIILLFGFGSYYLMMDWKSVPSIEEHPDWMPGARAEWFYEPGREWELVLGNGFMSNIENIVVHLCLFFGFMRFVDLAVMWKLF